MDWQATRRRTGDFPKPRSSTVHFLTDPVCERFVVLPLRRAMPCVIPWHIFCPTRRHDQPQPNPLLLMVTIRPERILEHVDDARQASPSGALHASLLAVGVVGTSRAR